MKSHFNSTFVRIAYAVVWLTTAGSVQAVPILHEITFIQGGMSVVVGDFFVENGLIGIANANTVIELPAVQNFNMALSA